jgi:MFS transporter, PAT family, beta-lactamase induction signal transducer AmpG
MGFGVFGVRRIKITPQELSSRSHPVVFLFLFLPWGMLTGYLGVAVGYLLAQAGMSAEQIAGLIALGFIPQTWKFLWAPLVDTILSQRKWYVLAALVTSGGIFGLGALPASPTFLPLITVVMLAAYVAGTLLCMSVESLMVYTMPDSEKGLASGWLQAGNLGGGGLGGGAGLWMAQHLPGAWMAGAVLGAASTLCCFALPFVPERQTASGSRRFIGDVASVLRDLWRVARSRVGFLALLIVFLPIGTGAASNLWAAVADSWRASADTVALVNGALGGIVSAAGCIAGGYLSDRIDRKTAYGLYGLLQALCAFAMALAPRTESMYIAFSMVYAFITGLTYAGFSAVVFEAIGLGAAATKYTLFASLSNFPIGYMTLVDGWALTRWGSAGMLHIEAAICVAGLLLFIIAAVIGTKRAAQFA